MVELQSIGYQPVFYPLKRVKDVLIKGQQVTVCLEESKYTSQEITVRDKHPDIFRKYWSQASLICFYTQTANRVWVLPDVIPCAHPEFRLWKTEVRKVKKTKQKTAYPSMAAQCLVSVFTACAKITIRAVQEEISCHLERMSDSLLTDLFI